MRNNEINIGDREHAYDMICATGGAPIRVIVKGKSGRAHDLFPCKGITHITFCSLIIRHG